MLTRLDTVLGSLAQLEDGPNCSSDEKTVIGGFLRRLQNKLFILNLVLFGKLFVDMSLAREGLQKPDLVVDKATALIEVLKSGLTAMLSNNEAFEPYL